MQSIAVFIPTTYVFEGMRALLVDGNFETGLMVKGFTLNIIYLIFGLIAFFIFQVPSPWSSFAIWGMIFVDSKLPNLEDKTL